MRALEILQERLGNALDFMHAKRTASFWRAVQGLLNGQRLWLTALGRNLPGECSDKHRIKAVDRLLGSAAIQTAMVELYAALAKLLLRRIRRPVILVDWTGADPGFGVLSAKLCFRGIRSGTPVGDVVRIAMYESFQEDGRASEDERRGVAEAGRALA